MISSTHAQHQHSTAVGLTGTGMMNEGRHQSQHPPTGPHHQHHSSSPAYKHQHCCCFGFQQYQDHRGNHQSHHQHQQQQQHAQNAVNLAYYQQQQQFVPQQQQQQQQWYNNNEFDPYAYEAINNWAATASTTEAWPTNNKPSSGSEQQQPQNNTSPMWTSASSEPQYNEFYSTYPTPPTPAGSSASSAEHPPSIPSDHYPPTPYSVDLSSPHSDCTSSVYHNNHLGYGGGPTSVSGGQSSGLEDDIPLHDLIGAAAEAVEADLLESMSEKAAGRPASTASTTSCYNNQQQQQHQQQQHAHHQQQQVAETAAPTSVESSPGTVSSPEPVTTQLAAAPSFRSTIKTPVKKAATKRKKPLYDSKQLQKCLSETCEDWAGQSVLPGYPLHTLAAVKRLKLSPKAPRVQPTPKVSPCRPSVLDSPVSDHGEVQEGCKQVRLSWMTPMTPLMARCNPRTPSPPPLASPASNYGEESEVMPCLESYSEKSVVARTDLREDEHDGVGLTFDSSCDVKQQLRKTDHITQTPLPKNTNSTATTSLCSNQFTYSCSNCRQSWPLEQTHVIAKHLTSNGLRGSAPQTKPVRSVFSQFFKHWSYKVRLLVNPQLKSVSSKTVLSCNYCSDGDFAVEATNEDLAADIHDHLVSRHPGQVGITNNGRRSSSDLDQFCYFCDRRVHDMNRHLDEYFSIHHSRLLALATCCHQKKSVGGKKLATIGEYHLLLLESV